MVKFNDPSRSLPQGLIEWKMMSDKFYRASEFIFIEISKDHNTMLKDYDFQVKNKKRVKRDYFPHLDEVYFIQIGYCLENLIKGILIRDNPSLVYRNEISKTIDTHNLKELARSLPIHLNEIELDLLEFLKHHILWYGKYPIPKKSKDLVQRSGHSVDRVREIFFIIYKKLILNIKSKNKDNQDIFNYKFTPVRHPSEKLIEI